MRSPAVVLVLSITASSASADPGDRWDGVMIAQQGGAGIGGGLVLGVAGLFAGAALASAGEEKGWAALGGAVIGGALGATTGVTLGVKLVGDHRGGNGGWAATAIGAAGGGLLVFVTAPSYADELPEWATLSLAMITLTAPAVIGYHLATDEISTSNESRVMVPLVLPF